MIWESCYWKDDLLQISEKISSHYQNLDPECEEIELVNFEKDIMLGAYIVRKLIEAGKLSNSVMEMKLDVVSYKALKNVTILN